VSGITTLQGGFPVTRRAQRSLGQDTDPTAVRTAIKRSTKTSRQPHDWLNPALFAIPTAVEIAAGNFYGNTGRDSVARTRTGDFDSRY